MKQDRHADPTLIFRGTIFKPFYLYLPRFSLKILYDSLKTIYCMRNTNTGWCWTYTLYADWLNYHAAKRRVAFHAGR